MDRMRLLLPSGSSPPVRGDDRERLAAASTSRLTTPALDELLSSQTLTPPPAPSCSPGSDGSLVKHDEHIARVTSEAYYELNRLSEIAVVIAAAKDAGTSSSSALPSDSHRPLPSHPKTRSRTTMMMAGPNSSPSTSSMFIKPRGKAKKAARGLELQSNLERNQNLLKSKEVCRLLSPSQLEKLKQDTKEMEALQEDAERKREKVRQDIPLEEVMLGLGMNDSSRDTREQGSRIPVQMQRGKARLISAEDNARLQRANFEAEQEMQRTRECELMGRQMGKISLSSSSASALARRRLESDRMIAAADRETADEEDEEEYDGGGEDDRYAQDMM